ncbi:MFS transporter [Pacificimonas flava]|uniref:Sugar transporter n=1 Tax=Pacificimonas flava TaxID=1234595 RepID=M2U3Y5_9SPHN|nr:MFS transporter [Pacificimonas flava]EMD82742.1 Sugar transporter [Pacificimonas flava]MBB5279361.1 Na+/melibiose symporter-like transporter [Pacificimonas flava]
MRQPAARLLAYAGPGIPIAAMGLPLVAFLPPYYAGELGLNLAAVGLVFFLVRALDVPFDPLVGHWADNTRTRLGRFKPWLIGGGLAAFVATALVFFPPEGVGTAFLFLTLLALYAGQSCINVPHTSWGATISSDYHERSRVFSFWQGGHLVGLVLVLLLPAILDGVLGEDAPGAVQAMGIFILVSLPVAILCAVIFVPRSNNRVDHPKIGWQELKLFFGQGELRTLLIVDILFSLGAGSLGALLRFFLEQSRGFTDTGSSLMLLVFFVSGLAALPLWLALARRIGKARTTGAACLYHMTLHVAAFPFLSGDNVGLGIVLMALAGISFAAPTFLLRSILADFNDAAKEKGANDRIGLLNAVLTTAQKLGYAVPVGVLLPLLDLAGFNAEPGAQNTPESLFWLETVWFCVIPVTLLPAALFMVFLKSDRLRHAASRAA